jgi:hypothetical protein
MKKGTVIIAITLFTTIGIGGCTQPNTHNELITVDVTASYPEKELILQDFMEVEYIPLETNDEFITQGVVMAIGNDNILVKNWVHDGDIFVYDVKTGKALRKINRKGQGPEEYTFISGIVLDEEKNEIFVNSFSTKKILVYDLLGNFKRSLEYAKGTEYSNVHNYDKDNLICYDTSIYYKHGEKRDKQSYHAIISKQDGSITQNISIPFDVIKAPVVIEGKGTVTTGIRTIIPYQNNWLLVETSSDTVYHYDSKENKLNPFLVKTPAVDPEIMLSMGVLTDRYYFIKTVKKAFDLSTGKGFPITDLMYDKQENAVFNITVFNDDFTTKQKVNLNSNMVNNTIAAFQNLPAEQLVEAYENNELKGKLKEIAAELDEESNPVLMLMRYKK